MNFGRPLRPGAITTVAVLHEVHDSTETFQHSVAATVYERWERLELAVVLPRGRTAQRAWSIARDGEGPDALEIWSTQVPTDCYRVIGPDEVEIRVVIPHPPLGSHYELHWDYSDSGGVHAIATEPAANASTTSPATLPEPTHEDVALP